MQYLLLIYDAESICAFHSKSQEGQRDTLTV
jgi:hypothetical protein